MRGLAQQQAREAIVLIRDRRQAQPRAQQRLRLRSAPAQGEEVGQVVVRHCVRRIRCDRAAKAAKSLRTPAGPHQQIAQVIVSAGSRRAWAQADRPVQNTILGRYQCRF